MKTKLSDESISQLFTEARSYHSWQNRSVPDELLNEIYDVSKWGPTAVNANPMRVIFIKTEKSRELLYPALSGSNVDQVKSAPVTAIIAQDEAFHEQLPRLFPAFDARALFAQDVPLRESTAFRNSSLQGAYLIMAARALGLDVCPMSGFDNSKVDEAFLTGTTWKSNFIMTLGYGIEEGLYPRGPRLSVDEAVRVI